MLAREIGVAFLGKMSPKLRSKGTDQNESRGGGHSTFGEPREHMCKEPQPVTFPLHTLSHKHKGRRKEATQRIKRAGLPKGECEELALGYGGTEMPN